MNPQFTLHETICAICGSKENSTELYKANVTPNDFTPEIFSARRLPDKIHYRIVRCNNCGLVRSDPTIHSNILTTLYAKSIQNYDLEVKNLTDTYFKYVQEAIKILGIKSIPKAGFLEIGCGSGFLLEKAIEYGFGLVLGIEPSVEAVNKSSAHIRPAIICDMLQPGMLQKENFDLICMFQVFDHIANPNALLSECVKALKPGGGLLIFNHDVRALSALVLGENSPIFDVEHTYLYNQNTIGKIAQKHGLKIKIISSATNRISLRHLTHLLPIKQSIKLYLLNKLKNTVFGNFVISLKLGNLFIIAQKP